MLDSKMPALNAVRSLSFLVRKNYRDNVKNWIVLLRKKLQEKMRKKSKNSVLGRSEGNSEKRLSVKGKRLKSKMLIAQT